MRLDEQRGTAEKRPDLEIRAGTPGALLRPASRGPWVPEAGDDTRPLPEARPEEWVLDQIRVQKLKRERQLRDGTANRTVSTGMSPGTRQLLDDIRRLAREGHTAADISARLDVTEAGVRNVLALGRGAFDQDAQGPIRIPELAAFQETWGRSWPGGNGNGNGANGHRKPQNPI